MEAMEEGDAHVLLSKLIGSSSRATAHEADEEQRAILLRMIDLSRSPDVRALLASHHAVATLLSLIAQNPPSLFLTLKLLRNLCADVSNQKAFLHSFGVESVAFQVDKALNSLTEKPEEMSSILQVCLQLLGNSCGGGKPQKEAVWRAFFPHRFKSLAFVKWEDKVLEPLCMVLYTCSHRDREKLKELCHGDGALLFSSCIRAATSNGVLANGAGEWIYLLILDLCLRQALLPLLFLNLSKDCPQEPLYSEDQASLLGFLVDILAQKIQVPGAFSQEDDIDFLALLDFLAETLQIASRFYRDGNVHIQATDSSILTAGPPCEVPIIAILGFTLELFKMFAGWEHSGKYDRSLIIAQLLHHGVIALCLELLEGLGPPDLIYKAMQHGNAEISDADRDKAGEYTGDIIHEGTIFEENQVEKPPTATRDTLPYKGYRRDLVAVLGNAAYQNRAVQDEVRILGGLLLILQQCVVDDANPYLREWGVWAIRNLVDGNDENCKEIAQLQLIGSLTPVELAERGYKVEMDEKLGRPRLVNTPMARD